MKLYVDGQVSEEQRFTGVLKTGGASFEVDDNLTLEGFLAKHRENFLEVHAKCPELYAKKEFEDLPEMSDFLSSGWKERLDKAIVEGTDIPECISLFIQSRVNVTQPKGTT